MGQESNEQITDVPTIEMGSVINHGGRLFKVSGVGRNGDDHLRFSFELLDSTDSVDEPVFSGVDLIAAERQRQIESKGWTADHDDDHDEGELVQAARAYATVYNFPTSVSAFGATADHVGWPWHHESWNPSDDPIRNLTKAGALIAAEIDRIQRTESDETGAES